MAVILEIRDGSPWYLSTDLWTVPDDPNGSPGLPIAGRPCYLFAHVKNNGPNALTDATLRFYWGNPAVGFDRNTANLIGQSFVSLASGQSDDVLCLTPWIPTFLNGGHECILAEAFHPSDPLPATPVFNVPTDPHVAQRNLSVVMAVNSMFRFVFEIHNQNREERKFDIEVHATNIDELKGLHSHFGKKMKLDFKKGEIKRAGFLDAACPSDKEVEDAKGEIKNLHMGPMQSQMKCLVGTISGGAVFLNVVQKYKGKVVGGLGVLVINA